MVKGKVFDFFVLKGLILVFFGSKYIHLWTGFLGVTSEFIYLYSENQIFHPGVVMVYTRV